jgi:O-antigen/teichoic acid export membrane protein
MEIENDLGIGNRALKSLSSLFAGKMFTILLTGITFIIVARLLGPSGYGVYTIAVGFSALVGAVGHFGVGTFLNRGLSDKTIISNKKVMSRTVYSAYLVVVSVAVVFTAIGIAMSGYAASNIFHNPSITPLVFEIAAMSLFFSIVYGTSYAGLIGAGRSTDAAYVSIYAHVAQLLGSVMLIYMGYGVAGAIGGILLGNILGFIVSSHFMLRRLKRLGLTDAMPDNRSIMEVLTFSLPIATNNLLGSTGVNSLAVLIIGIFATTAVLGDYGASMKGYQLIVVFYGTITTVLLPALVAALSNSRYQGHIRSLYERTLIYSILISMPILVTIGIFAKPILYTFLSSSFRYAPEYLTLICGGVILNLIGLFSASFFVAAGKVRTVLKYTVISTVAEIASLVYLVPIMGTIGAIIAIFYVGTVIEDAMFIRGMKDVFDLKPNYRDMAALLASGAMLALTLYLATLMHGILLEGIAAAAVLLFIYPIIVLILGIINKERLDEIQNATRQIPVIETAGRFMAWYLREFDRIAKTGMLD